MGGGKEWKGEEGKEQESGRGWEGEDNVGRLWAIANLKC